MWRKEETRNILNEIYKRSIKDMEFRKEIINNPKKVIKEVFGIEIPDQLNIKFVESQENFTQTFVLPDLEDGLLSDDQLDKVAGGGRRTPDYQGRKGSFL